MQIEVEHLVRLKWEQQLWRLNKHIPQEDSKEIIKNWSKLENHLLESQPNHCLIQCIYGMETLKDQKEANGRQVFSISRWLFHKLILQNHHKLSYLHQFLIQMYLAHNFALICWQMLRSQSFTRVGFQHILLKLFWFSCNHFYLKSCQKIL